MSAPPKFSDLAGTVDTLLTVGDKVEGWTIDALEDCAANKCEAFPFAKNGGVGIHVIYNNAARGITVKSDISSDQKHWCFMLPTISYLTTAGPNTHKVEYNVLRSMMSYSLKNPSVNITSNVAVRDGFSGVSSITGRLFERVDLGACADYDPKRSGLKDLTVVAARRECPNVGGGDVLLKYSLREGLGLHVRVPLRPLTDVAVIAEKHRFIAGVQTRSPCGARMICNTNVNDGTVTMTAIRNLNDIWKFTASYTTGSLGAGGAGKQPRFGLKFSNDSMLD